MHDHVMNEVACPHDRAVCQERDPFGIRFLFIDLSPQGHLASPRVRVGIISSDNCITLLDVHHPVSPQNNR